MYFHVNFIPGFDQTTSPPALHRTGSCLTSPSTSTYMVGATLMTSKDSKTFPNILRVHS